MDQKASTRKESWATIRLHPEHRREVEKAAELEHVSLSEFARGALLRAARRRIRQAEEVHAA